MKERIIKYILWFLTVFLAFLLGVGLTAHNLRKLIPEEEDIQYTVVVEYVTEVEEVEQEDEKETEQPMEVEPVETSVNMGEFKLTGYCDCSYCCGKTDGITATGTKATEGRTIAVDPDVIPYGSVVIINGNEYIAEDTGGVIDGKRIDMFFDEHSDALEFGVQMAEIYVKS